MEDGGRHDWGGVVFKRRHTSHAEGPPKGKVSLIEKVKSNT